MGPRLPGGGLDSACPEEGTARSGRGGETYGRSHLRGLGEQPRVDAPALDLGRFPARGEACAQGASGETSKEEERETPTPLPGPPEDAHLIGAPREAVPAGAQRGLGQDGGLQAGGRGLSKAELLGTAGSQRNQVTETVNAFRLEHAGQGATSRPEPTPAECVTEGGQPAQTVLSETWRL